MTPTELLSLFLPLFVAMDPLGVFPAFVQITSDLSPKKRGRILFLSVLTAGAVGLLFIPLGPLALSSLGLKNGDFQIAGGLLILVVALRDIVLNQKMFQGKDLQGMGVVPIGIPLLVGPAVLTTLILLRDRFSPFAVAASLILNLLIAWGIFAFSSRLIRWLGVTGSLVVSKLAALLLAAYAVMMIRVGFSSFL
ncbi:MAG TPA: MarC family protein [bacterium]